MTLYMCTYITCPLAHILLPAPLFQRVWLRAWNSKGDRGEDGVEDNGGDKDEIHVCEGATGSVLIFADWTFSSCCFLSERWWWGWRWKWCGVLERRTCAEVSEQICIIPGAHSFPSEILCANAYTFTISCIVHCIPVQCCYIDLFTCVLTGWRWSSWCCYLRSRWGELQLE